MTCVTKKVDFRLRLFTDIHTHMATCICEENIIVFTKTVVVVNEDKGE